jgi:hypothetical protein
VWLRAGLAAWRLILATVTRHHRPMFVLVLGMVMSVGLAVAVVCVVAVPARRDGRDVLTAKGEDVVSTVRDRTGSAVETAREKTGEAFGAARDKMADVSRPNEP